MFEKPFLSFFFSFFFLLICIYIYIYINDKRNKEGVCFDYSHFVLNKVNEIKGLRFWYFIYIINYLKWGIFVGLYYKRNGGTKLFV